MMHRFLQGLWAVLAAAPLAWGERPHLLLITVDDMSADSVGAFGCEVAQTTPHLDRLAAEGLRFELAHVQVGNCMPSRNVMWSGRYPHGNGVEGFYPVPNPAYPVLGDLLRSAGYFTGIRGKVNHSTPYHPFPWDEVLDTLPDGTRAHPKDPASYGASTLRGIRAAQTAGKPFCLLINIADPHKPFYGEGRRGTVTSDPHVPSRVFAAEDIVVPGFLPDDPVVRREVARYYSTVRRADDAVGEVLAALEASGEGPRTLVLFLSDHGMPFPFAKTQLYHHSTRTPLIVRWPGRTRAGGVDRRHMVSAVDLLPTLLDVIGEAHPPGLSGRSFKTLLTGHSQPLRDRVFKVYNENSGGKRHPMRAIETREFLYLFNPWSNGQRVMATATTGTATYRRMRELASVDPRIAARLEHFDHRTVEEFYLIREDPEALRNCIEDPRFTRQIALLREALEEAMRDTDDPLLEVFRQRDDAEAREAFMARVQSESDVRRARRGTANGDALSRPPLPRLPQEVVEEE